MLRYLFPVLLLSFFGFSLSGQTGSTSQRSPDLALPDRPEIIIGKTLSELFAQFGPPITVLANRGDEAWQDDVSLEYPTGFSFFVFGDRVWQIRFTPPYVASFFSVFLGDSPDKVIEVLGLPYESRTDILVYRLPYSGFPLRLKLLFEDNKMSDAYVYRADF